jgi:hypothetical protein
MSKSPPRQTFVFDQGAPAPVTIIFNTIILNAAAPTHQLDEIHLKRQQQQERDDTEFIQSATWWALAGLAIAFTVAFVGSR